MNLETPSYKDRIVKAAEKLGEILLHTPLQYASRLSKKYECKIYIKREDMQIVRSYKIRGAYNNIINLSDKQKEEGVVCASAGNHAQGVALSAKKLKVKAFIFMPQVTPRQKIQKVQSFGCEFIEIILTGNTYDDAYEAAMNYANEHKRAFVHPFDDMNTILGQASMAIEIDRELPTVDTIIAPIGGGGLISGLSLYFKEVRPKVNIIGIEPQGASKMQAALKEGKPVVLPSIDTFVDGAAVKEIGKLNFEIASERVDKFITVPEGKVCTTIIELYQNEGIITEPAGCLSIAALDDLKNEIKGKQVVCILSGGNNDLSRYPEIVERSLIYEGLKHYFIIEFAQKPGELRKFLNHVLGPTDDIVNFNYLKKTNTEYGPALVGIELTKKEDIDKLIEKLKQLEISFINVKDHELLRKYLI